MIIRLVLTVLFSIAFLLSVGGVAAQSPSSTSQQPSASTTETDIRSVCTRYFGAYAAHDASLVQSFLSSKSPYFETQIAEVKKAVAEAERIEANIISFDNILSDKDQVKLWVTVQAIRTDAKTAKTAEVVFSSKNRFLSFVREGNDWKIYQHTSAEAELVDRIANAKTEHERDELVRDGARLTLPVFLEAFASKGHELLFRDKEFVTAATVLKVALDIARKSGDNKSIGRFTNNVGITYYSQGDLVNAAKYYEQAVKLGRELNEPEIEIGGVSNLALVYYDLGDIEKAIEAASRALEYRQRTGNTGRAQRLMLNLAVFYKDGRGDYSRALQYYQKALELSDPKDPFYSALLGNIGVLYKQQGNLDLALDYFERVLKLQEGQEGRSRTAGTLVNIGTVYVLQAKFEKALECFEAAVQQFETIGRKDGIAAVFDNIGYIYREQGNYTKALEYHTKALKARDGPAGSRGMDGLQLAIAQDHLLLGDTKSALEISEPIAARAKLSSEQIGSPAANFITGKIYRVLGEYSKSQRYLEAAVQIEEDLRAKVAGSEFDRQRFFEDRVSPYRDLIKLQLDMQQIDDAFSTAERVKARVVMDVLLGSKINVNRLMTGEEQNAEKGHRAEISSLTSQIEIERGRPSPDAARLDDLTRQLSRKRLEIEDFRTRLYAAHPQLKVQRGEFKPATLIELGSLLTDDKSALMEYVVDGDRTILFVINRDDSKKLVLKSFVIDIKDKDLAKVVEDYRSTLSGGDLNFQKQSRELYELLLKPAQAQLSGKTNLIVVPDGPLWNLTFQSLLNDKNKYLAEDVAIAYAPSLSALAEMKKKAGTRRGDIRSELLAFGNPAAGNDPAGRGNSNVLMSETLYPLVETERLVSELGRIYGPDKSKVFIGSEATEGAAKSQSSKFKIVQFATHGVLNNTSPMYSHLLLAKNDKNTNEDGLLEAWEMKDLDLNADMVILSACETARGRISNGEGMIGMSWALFIAGTPTTVASQWKVSAASTTELMLEFHRQMLKGRVSKAEALRQASLKVMKMPGFKHPSYWAGFVLVGDGR